MIAEVDRNEEQKKRRKAAQRRIPAGGPNGTERTQKLFYRVFDLTFPGDRLPGASGVPTQLFLSILTLLLLYIPSWIQVKLRIEIPTGLEIAILCFIFAAEILGEINAFYIMIPGWDTILHTLNGFLCAAIGFSLVLLLNNDERLTFELSPFFLALVAFCFSMTVGVIWEFFECAMDQFLRLDMQKDTIIHAVSSVMLDQAGGNHPVSIRDIADVIVVHSDGTKQALGLGGYLDIGLLDTMKDLFVNFIGAVVFAVIGFFYARGKGKKGVISLFVPRKKARNKDYLSIVKRKLE